MALTLLKLGGELLEEPARLAEIAAVIASATEPLVVVHGGGREIDAALKRAGIPKRQVEGLRVTDPATLDIVVEVLAGAVNTRLVSAIVKAGGRAVGLSAAAARGCAPAHGGVGGGRARTAPRLPASRPALPAVRGGDPVPRPGRREPHRLLVPGLPDLRRLVGGDRPPAA